MSLLQAAIFRGLWFRGELRAGSGLVKLASQAITVDAIRKRLEDLGPLFAVIRRRGGADFSWADPGAYCFCSEGRNSAAT